MRELYSTDLVIESMIVSRNSFGQRPKPFTSGSWILFEKEFHGHCVVETFWLSQALTQRGYEIHLMDRELTSMEPL